MLHVALIAGMLYYLHACFSRIMACFDRIMAMCWPYHVHGLPVLWPCFPVSCPCFTRIKVNIITKCQHHGKNVNTMAKMSNIVSLKTRFYLMNSVSLKTRVYLINSVSIKPMFI